VRVRRRGFQNSGRSVHRQALIERSSSSRRPDGTTPPADWKRSAFAVTELPADDPANSRRYRARTRVLTLAAALHGKRPGRYTH